MRTLYFFPHIYSFAIFVKYFKLISRVTPSLVLLLAGILRILPLLLQRLPHLQLLQPRPQLLLPLLHVLLPTHFKISRPICEKKFGLLKKVFIQEFGSDQCCRSGILFRIPDPNFFHAGPRIRIFFHPGSASKN
jgi:hypothetical protein